MIAIAMSSGKPEPVFDLRQLLEMIERDYQLDVMDVANLISEAVNNYTQYPELESCFEEFEVNKHNTQDGVWGDAFYIACEEIRNTQEEIRAEINALRSTSRKGNTKEDIARRLENIVSNMSGIL